MECHHMKNHRKFYNSKFLIGIVLRKKHLSCHVAPVDIKLYRMLNYQCHSKNFKIVFPLKVDHLS